MSVLNSIDMQRRPTHPGEMLREDFLPDYHLSVSALAKALGVSRRSMSELCRERRAVSPEMALRLARLFGNSAAFWINAQRAVDLWDAAQTIKDEVAKIEPLHASHSAVPAVPHPRDRLRFSGERRDLSPFLPKVIENNRVSIYCVIPR